MNDKYRNTEKELFKLQTQIRAQLNILRSTYKQLTSEQKLTKQRKHFPNKLYEQTLNIQQDEFYKNRDKSRSAEIVTRRGKKSISPMYTQIRNSVSPYQRKHFPKQFQDNVKIQFKKRRNYSPFLGKRKSTNNYTPPKMNNPIIGDNKDSAVQYRPTKRMSTDHHQFDFKFFG